jgi:hypothetical protein
MAGKGHQDMNLARRRLDPRRTITIVSGLPRSGTSMMMQMLGAAGLSIATDGRRIADADNPRGYYELEAVKRLREDASFLARFTGRVVKVVAPLLPFVPADYAYRVLFMERDLHEILASQRVMLDRRGTAADGPDDGMLEQAFGSRIRHVKHWLAEQNHVQTCFVSHHRLISSPAEACAEVASFLDATGAFAATPGEHEAGEQIAARMAGILEPALYRARRDRIR